MFGKNYIIIAALSVAVLSVATMKAADEYQLMFGGAATSSAAQRPSARQAEHPLVAQLDSVFAGVRSAFLPGSSALQSEMENDLVQIVTLLRSANEVVVEATWHEPERALALERAENLRTRLQLYGLPPGRLRLTGQEGDNRTVLTPVITR